MYTPPREYSRESKIQTMREIDAGRRIAEVAREHRISPQLIEKWRALWRAQGEAAFPGRGRQGAGEPGTEQQRIAELERKIGQLTMENDFLKKAWRVSTERNGAPSSVAMLPLRRLPSRL